MKKWAKLMLKEVEIWYYGLTGRNTGEVNIFKGAEEMDFFGVDFENQQYVIIFILYDFIL